MDVSVAETTYDSEIEEVSAPATTEPSSTSITPDLIEWYYNSIFGVNGSACCYDSFPKERVTICGNPSPHYFCFRCAERNAEQGIVNQK